MDDDKMREQNQAARLLFTTYLNTITAFWSSFDRQFNRSIDMFSHHHLPTPPFFSRHVNQTPIGRVGREQTPLKTKTARDRGTTQKGKHRLRGDRLVPVTFQPLYPTHLVTRAHRQPSVMGLRDTQSLHTTIIDPSI